ncbi:hypothetical protein NSE_0772 [Neorickettsia sennetsu str. Miyayama]|uniref:Uncharacterized protein n=1 Tax=Ehrlichia sennetsu (strain ATCC VR-367 / Miyayama) TaxID=222891 RepID=Q2GCZ9_EHRS3|nr:hypothetical protein NSE_0772 [Neorickettsia sennetsu str. Miyayama]
MVYVSNDCKVPNVFHEIFLSTDIQGNWSEETRYTAPYIHP